MKRICLVTMVLLAIGLAVRHSYARAAVPSTIRHDVLIAEVEREDEGEDDEFEREDDRPAPIEQVTPQTNTPVQDVVDTNTTVPLETTVEPSAAAQDTVSPSVDQTPVLTTGETPSIPDVRTLPVSQRPFPWAWLVTRAAGITSFLTLTLLSIVGMLLTTGALFRFMSPATAWSFHRAIATALLFSVSTHIAGLLLDTFMNLHVLDVFVPFVSAYRPLLVALGIFGFYLMLLLLASSLYTMTKYPRFWRTVHALSFVMYTLIFLHGVLIGTDATQWWAVAMYWTSGVAVGAAVVYRLIWKYRRVA